MESIRIPSSKTQSPTPGRSSTQGRPQLSGRNHFCPANRNAVAESSIRGLWRERIHLLATIRLMDQARGVGRNPQGVAQRIGIGGSNRPVHGGDRLGFSESRFWGIHTGPNPTDRAKKGCKRHLITDANGTPLLLHTTPANRRDDTPVVEMVKALPAIKQPKGRPRKKPGELLGDRGYGFALLIAAIVMMGIVSLLAPRAEAGEKDAPKVHSGLGKRRYVIERTLSWFGNYRRLKLCYERKGQHFQAFNELAACLICANKLSLV